MPLSTYYNNTGGLNLANSPFAVASNQATGGYCYEYSRPGAIVKTLGRSKLNSVADAQLRSLGFSSHISESGTLQVLRAAGTKIQTVDTSLGTFTNKSSDEAAPISDFFASGSTQPVVSAAFDTPDASVVWFAGGGATALCGYSGTSVTQNGVATPTGTFTAGVGGSSGTWTATGTYYYAIALRKTSTQALSNAGLDQVAVIAANTQVVTLTFPTGVDATKYDKWYVYRSAVSGASAFTTGTLVALVTVGTTTYVDLGNVSVATAQNVPRADSLALDNSPLPSGTYKSIVAFKSRLVTASDNVVYVSDLNKPESWSADLAITLPYGGPVTGLAVIGSLSDLTDNTDEFLIIFQERNMWLITGTFFYDDNTGLYDFELKFVDKTGCPVQSLILNGDGFIGWVSYGGVYLWDGKGKPMNTSRPIKTLFDQGGDLDQSKLPMGWGVYYQKKNQFVWTISHRTIGENKVQLKLDLSLTTPNIEDGPGGRYMDGVFLMDKTDSLYGGTTFYPSTKDEYFISGDASGYAYRMYFSASDNSGGIPFTYDTSFLDQDKPGVTKRYKKVLVWVDPLAATDLTLNYWVDYKLQEEDQTSISLPTGSSNSSAASLWDVALWDESLWDAYQNTPKCVVFNLKADNNNLEGDCIRLEFEQTEASAPVVIHGYSILWEDLGLKK
jgi:hypothetical protein